MSYELIIIGTSAGGIDALKELFQYLDSKITQPIIIVQHLEPKSHSYLSAIIGEISGKKAFEAEAMMVIEDGCIYVPAPNYHLMMEKDWTLSLNVEKRVSYARPSIDILFESAADAVKDKVLGVILTGANGDGANGLLTVKDQGGYTLVQDPKTAYAREMPEKCIAKVKPHDVLTLKEMAIRINKLTSGFND